MGQLLPHLGIILTRLRNHRRARTLDNIFQPSMEINLHTLTKLSNHVKILNPACQARYAITIPDTRTELTRQGQCQLSHGE